MSTLLTVQTLRREAKVAQQRRAEDPDMRFFNNNRQDNGPFRDSTFLFIKAVVGDAGERPLPAGTVFWNSPHIELYEGANPIPTNQLKAGQNYRVEVTITNSGDLEAPSCSVDLFICNPTLGFNVAAGRLIGLQSAEVGPHDAAKVVFDFKATATDIGHRCLFARVSSVSTKDYPADASAFNTVDDRHIGQQNLSIVKQGEMLLIDVAPLLQADFEISLVRSNTLFKEFKRYSVLKNQKSINKGLSADFKLLEIKEPQISEDKQRKLIDKIRPLATDLFNTPRVATQPLQIKKLGQQRLETNTAVNNVLNQVRPLPAITKNKWQIVKDGERQMFRRTLLMVPEIGLKQNEVVIYLLQMKDKQGKTTGGITLVVTA